MIPAEMDNTHNSPRHSLAKQPLLLLLEDDDYCAKEYEKVAKDLGWEVVKARHLKGVEALAKKRKGQIRFAVVDLMIPANQKNLEDVELWLTKKEEVRKRRTTRANPTKLDANELRTAFKELDRIEQELRKLILLDGGIQFLHKAAKHGWLDGAEIVIFSARDNTKPELASQIAELEKLFPGLGFMQKPVPTKIIKDLLSEKRRTA